MPELVSLSTSLLLWGALGYLVGSVPFGIVVSRAMGLGNLRQVGSGNIGATNVLRTGSKAAAAMTLLLDGGKGLVIVLLSRVFAAEDAAQVAALCAMVGHCFPIWLMFRGGKGVATFLGILYALSWPIGIAASATWLVTAAIFRYSSLAALVAATSTLVWCYVFDAQQIFMLCLALIALIFWRHAGNIRRLFAGSESKIGSKG